MKTNKKKSHRRPPISSKETKNNIQSGSISKSISQGENIVQWLEQLQPGDKIGKYKRNTVTAVEAVPMGKMITIHLPRVRE